MGRISNTDKYKFTLGADDVAVSGYDDEGRAWVGAPDIIGIANNKITLADLKTSVKPYSRFWPKDFEKGSQPWKDLIGGNMKFKKTCKQLAAYDIAIEQTWYKNTTGSDTSFNSKKNTNI